MPVTKRFPAARDRVIRRYPLARTIWRRKPETESWPYLVHEYRIVRDVRNGVIELCDWQPTEAAAWTAAAKFIGAQG